MDNTNLAYTLEEQIEEQNEEQSEVKIKPKSQPKQKAEYKWVKYVVIITVAAIYLISKHVAVYETQKQIKDLQTEIAEIDGYTKQKTFELEQNMDLAKVEDIATTKLGMQRPEKYQIEYVNINLDDVTEITQKDVEGFANRVGTFMSNLKKNVIGIFSLK